MPRKKYHETLAENIREAKEEKPADVKADEPTVEDLDDTVVQQRIMDPNGTPITLSYGKVLVYPYSIRDKRKGAGFLAQVFADAVGAGSRSKDEFQLRVASLLTRRDDLERELFRLFALACGKPGTMDDNKTLPLIAEMQEKCTTADVMELFSAVSTLSEFSAPKL